LVEKRERDAAAPGFFDEQPFLSALVLVVRGGTRRSSLASDSRRALALVGAAG
jgi:hypothetical protein